MVVTSYKLVNEVSDEKRFHKSVSAPLREVRNLVGDGLFTVRIILTHHSFQIDDRR